MAQLPERYAADRFRRCDQHAGRRRFAKHSPAESRCRASIRILNNDRNLINPAAFSIPLPGTFGDLPRNALRGPNFKQFDLVLNKRFPLTESTNIEFRTEIFNIFNFANFAVPSTTLNNALPTITRPRVWCRHRKSSAGQWLHAVAGRRNVWSAATNG